MLAWPQADAGSVRRQDLRASKLWVNECSSGTIRRTAQGRVCDITQCQHASQAHRAYHSPRRVRSCIDGFLRQCGRRTVGQFPRGLAIAGCVRPSGAALTAQSVGDIPHLCRSKFATIRGSLGVTYGNCQDHRDEHHRSLRSTRQDQPRCSPRAISLHAADSLSALAAPRGGRYQFHLAPLRRSTEPDTDRPPDTGGHRS